MRFSLWFGLAAATTTFFDERFLSDEIPTTWVVSQHKQDYGLWSISNGKFHSTDIKEARGLKTTQDARFYSISSKLDHIVHTNKVDQLILQFTVKFEQGIDCGGGYLKLLPPSFDPLMFTGDSEYSIMFGPDVCGGDSKTHAILNYNGVNHLIDPPLRAEKDQLTHIYTLILNKDKTFKFLLDNEIVESGSILKHWKLLEPETIKDPKASKPLDWVDAETIDDESDKKPDGYDDVPRLVDDVDAKKPDDWDDEEDGDWVAPKLPNPDFLGEWKAKQIPNPDFKGVWVHPIIPNPDFKPATGLADYEIGFIGFDLWQVKSGTIFDDILITDDEALATERAVAIMKRKEEENIAKDLNDKVESAKVEKENNKEEGKDVVVDDEEFNKEEGKNVVVDDEEVNGEEHDEL